MKIEVRDNESNPIDAVVPVEVRITDPEGVEIERSGHYGAKSGVIEFALDIAPNDQTGLWQIQAREGASGKTGVAYIRINN